MIDFPNELVENVAKGAEQYINETDIDSLINRAAIVWTRIDSDLKPNRPETGFVREFLGKVIEGAFRKTVGKLTSSHKEVAAVTLTFATQELITYLISDLGWKILTPYQIPLEIIAGVFYIKLLEEIKKASPKG